MQQMALMAKPARMEPLATPGLQELQQRIQPLMQMVSQLQHKLALQGLPENKELVVPPALTARWVEAFQP